MKCVICNDKQLEEIDIEVDDGHIDTPAAQSSRVELNSDSHTLYVCNECKSLHIYCLECDGPIKFVRRYCCMNGNYESHAIKSWRDKSGNHSTTTDLEHSIIEPLMTKSIIEESDVINSCFNIAQVVKFKDSNDLSFDIEMHMIHDFPMPFNVSDLDMYALNPNDTRLISQAEVGLADVGTGFNIQERTWAEWECPHGIFHISGHDD